MAHYRYLVANLLSPFTIRDEVPLTACTYNHALNDAGSFTASIPIRSSKATRANFDPGRTALFVERDNVLVWGGTLEGARKQDDSLQLSGLGFWYQLAQARRIRLLKTYAGADQFFIAQDLLNYAQSQPDGNIGAVIPATTSGVLRDRTYNAYERKPIGEAIQQLAAVQNGFDFAVEVLYPTATSLPQLQVNLSYPRRGSRRQDLVFEQGKNLINLDYTIDATRMARTIDALGSGNGDDMLISAAQDATLAGLYPIRDDVASYKDVIDPATLAGYAASNLAAQLTPTFLPVATVQSAPDMVTGSWITGDQVQVRANDGYTQISSWFRIMAWGASVDSEGTETVQVAFAPVELFV